SQPRGVTVADIDGDSDLDLLVANAGSDNVSVFQNNGAGLFTLSSTLAVGEFPGGVTAADIDGDSDFDMLVPNIFSNTVSVKINNGSGVFTAAADVPVGREPYRVAMSDLDDDGDLDMLVANFAGNTVSVRFNDVSVLADLVVSTPQDVSGTYRNVTVTGPATGGAGTATLTGALAVVGTLTVHDGGTLGICDPLGIELTGNTGSVRLTGTRSFSNDASYLYNGTVAQVTGGALPGQVRNLGTTNATDVTLTGPETVMQALTVGAAGNVVLNGQALTLPSTAAGTALVVNSGAGTVRGNTATVQRYVDPGANPGLGYRHYSAPVASATVADLGTAGFAPVVSGDYNTSATPGQVTPFPTVYGYDQSRLATTANNLPAFDRGWLSPLSTGAGLTPGLGYTVNIAAAEKVDFVGTLNNGSLTVPLARSAGPTAADAGWALVGNPYPAPLNWTLVAAADRPNLDASMYVFESSAQYSGAYRAYVNGVGAGNPLIGSSQGFFVRVSPGQTAGSLTFRNAQRATSYASQVPFRRGAAEARPLVQLRLRGAAGPADALFVYAESGASAGFDPGYDAAKLSNPSGLNLAALADNDASLAIAGLAQFTAATAVALRVGVPAAGSYVLNAEQLLNLPTNLDAYLFDAQTGQQINLRQQSSYSFSVSAAQAAQAQAGRFELRFGPAAGPLAAVSAR
ncbi:MAG: VCBS repeat-containing protein, partial [Hymenobacter sp.]|nr:VCBS repeat-containing protein [Hymenobacter sp.]